MADPEEPGTPEAEKVETPPQEETPKAAEATPEAPLKPEPDWRKAYEAEQKTNSRLARRLDEAVSTSRELTEALKIIRTGQEAIAKATLPPDQAEAFIAQGKAAEDASKAKRTTDQAAALVTAQQRILKATLEQAGIDPKTIDWADDAGSVDEWAERVHASVQTRIAEGRNALLGSVEKAVRTKTKETEAKLKDETRRALKEAGADKIDVSQGSATTFAQRLAQTDPNSKEFAELTELALQGRLRGVA